jgi:hypothetical protein
MGHVYNTKLIANPFLKQLYNRIQYVNVIQGGASSYQLVYKPISV